MTSEIQYIKGIGPKRVKALENQGLKTIWDLLNFFPRRYLDRSKIVPLNEISKNSEVTVWGKIEAVGVRRGRKPRFYLIISDGSGVLEAVWFNYVNQYKTMFKVGEWISLSGKVTFFRTYQMVHPDYDKLGDGEFVDLVNTGKIIPVYPGNEEFRQVGLNSYTFRKIYQSILTSSLKNMQEIFPPALRERNKFITRYESYKNIHIPLSFEVLAQSLRRLKYEEFFFIQLMLALQNTHLKKEAPGITFAKTSIHLQQLFDRLPFTMTNAQKKVVREIRSDMKRAHPMNRLLQGDVGSGKTLVALMAMLIAIDNGYQVALMVPTEVLAEQHYLNITRALEDMDVLVKLLTKNTSAAEREEIRGSLVSGDPLIVVGTQALIQQGVKFSRLGLVVIDEQHRFGVVQRATLLGKGSLADMLVMTATPIPRTLALTVYGNLDVSILDEMPPNRKPVKTIWRFDDKTREINNFIKEEVDNGRQVFIVYPLVEESEKLDLKAAKESFNHNKNDEFAGYTTALLHGRLKSDEKEQIMREFAGGKTQILFSTTVIEVGVDVANATVMVIEHAERFGLSQLHQLRGRVGRGSEKSYCILKTPKRISDTAQKRLRIMTKTTDGFKIAEEDLTIRGWGEFFGTRQHGLPSFKIANPVLDQDILQLSRKDAFNLVNRDPHLRQEENSHLKDYFLKNYGEKISFIDIG